MSLNSIFVLGMHRSGTSALAGALHRLGIQFESDADRLSAGPDNPNGFYERTSIGLFSDLLLSTQEWTWHTVDLVPVDIDKASAHIDRARHIIDEMSGDGPVGLKDPRSCLLMPFWRRALLDRIEAVVITRDPAEVAWSLHVRDGLPVSVGLALWIAYSAHLANGTQGMSPHILRYENLVNSPATELASIAQFLQERGVSILHQETTTEVAAKSIDPTLRRDTVPAWVYAHPLTIEARAIRELFHQTQTTDISMKPSELCQEVLDLHRTSLRLDAVQHQYNLACADLQNERSNHESVIAQSQNDYTKAIAMVAEQVDELTTAKTELEHRLLLLSREYEHTRQQLEITTHSSSLKLGLFLSWPLRRLRFSKRLS